jgi:hypothetical protein
MGAPSDIAEAQRENVERLTAALHAAQAQGLLGRPEVVRQLLLGIASAVTAAVEGNRRRSELAPALRSDAYWEHFEMEMKEALLGAFAGLDPQLTQTIRAAIDATFRELEKTYRYS